MRKELLAKASRRDFAAVSADDSASYGIKDTGAGYVFADDESAGDLPEFLITQKAGADPAKHAVCFPINLMCFCTLPDAHADTELTRRANA